MSLKTLSSLLKEILDDLARSSLSQPSLNKAHLEALDTWRAKLPIYLRLRPQNSTSSDTFYHEANNRQKRSLVSSTSPILFIDFQAEFRYSWSFTQCTLEQFVIYCSQFYFNHFNHRLNLILLNPVKTYLDGK